VKASKRPHKKAGSSPRTKAGAPAAVKGSTAPIATTDSTAQSGLGRPRREQDEPSGLQSQTVGSRGPVLEQDSVLHETLEVFINEKPLERPVHVKGFGALGHFQTTHAMTEYTKLSFVQSPGTTVPVAARFSLAVSVRGTPDTARNVRALSTKFHTGEGVFDLLCNHIPVFLVRDGIRFPEAIHAFLPSPVDNLPDPNRLWRFVARAPEAMHFIVWLYSGLGTVKSLRTIRTYGVNTYVWRNAAGVRRYVKYHWLPLAGEQHIDRQEATRLAGENPDIAGQDLHDTLAAGKTVEYELRVQLLAPEEAGALPFDPLDVTKVWDEDRHPLLPVGRLILDRNPDDYMAQVEKLAFSPSNLLDGVELSDDKLLQGRPNIYGDSQRRRMGPEFRSIPINHQESWTPSAQVTSGAGRQVAGELVRSDIQRPDDFSQAGQYYRALSPVEQEHLVDNLAADLGVVDGDTLPIVLGYLSQASTELRERIAGKIIGNRRR
jgi:catalase